MWDASPKASAGLTALSRAQSRSSAASDVYKRQRREYIDSVLGNLKSQLDHTYVVDDQGNKRKLKQKED